MEYKKTLKALIEMLGILIVSCNKILFVTIFLIKLLFTESVSIDTDLANSMTS